MKHQKTTRYFSFITAIILLSSFLFSPISVPGALKTSDLETAAWTAVAEHSIIDTGGWLQSMCATDQYIVCLIDGNKKDTRPDTLIALYRNSTDANGNPVEPYSYAFHVTEMDYEHGNGMTYNPNTQEIAIAGLFTNNPDNAGAVFIVDANTLRFKRKVQVGNGSLNYFGIDYVPEKDQYVLMANRISDYSFVFTDGNFQITDTLNLGLSSSRSSFQDFIVDGDLIISIPYMQRDGFMNVIDVYSISQKKRVGSYYLTLPGHDAFDVEPEGICQLEDGHLLMASAILDTTNFKLYDIQLPVVHSVTTFAENGTITETAPEIPRGESHTVSYQAEENYRLKSLTVDGQEQNPEEFPTEYTFSDLQTDHTISAVFEEIPRYTVTTSARHGTIDTSPSALEHETLTVNFTPEEHYELEQLLIDGSPAEVSSDTTSYTFPELTSDHTLEAVFAPVPTYTIDVTAKNGSVQEKQATVYRGDSYIIHETPDNSYTLTKCMVNGKRTSLKRTDQGLVLENIQGNQTVTLIYGRIWLRILISALCFCTLFLFGFFYLRIRRKRAQRRRAIELRKMRRKARAFFSELDEMEEEQNQPEETPLSSDELEELLRELNSDT